MNLGENETKLREAGIGVDVPPDQRWRDAVPGVRSESNRIPRIEMKTIQPFTPSGRRLRLWLWPVSWIVAALTVWTIVGIVAFIRDVSIQNILTTEGRWPLVLILPGFALGKILGFMAANGIAHSLPDLRRTFEAECDTTGRNDYSRSMTILWTWAMGAGGCVVLGVAAFLLWA